MKLARRGLLLAVLHLAIVAGVAGKYLIDRSTLPRAWVKAAPFDPNLPIRGRYVRLAIEVTLRDAQPQPTTRPGRVGGVGGDHVKLSVDNGQLVATATERGTGVRLRYGSTSTLAEPVVFFIPEHIPDPARRAQGEELWVEVSVPGKGPPRPVRLGVKRDAILTPLDLR